MTLMVVAVLNTVFLVVLALALLALALLSQNLNNRLARSEEKMKRLAREESTKRQRLAST